MRNHYHYWDQELSRQYCNELIQKCLKLPLHPGTIKKAVGQNEDASFRSSQIAWTDDAEIRGIISNYLLKANRMSFGLDADFIPSVQFSKYEEGSYYNFHDDVDWYNSSTMYDRKVSITIQLSDETSYSGGDFEFSSSRLVTPSEFRNQGTIIAFPSYIQHRVAPITQGVRYSLVCWMEGPRWR